MDSPIYKINKLLNKTKKVLSLFILKIFNKNGQIASEQTELDKKLVYSLSKSKIPNLKQIKYIGKYLDAKEVWLMRASFIVLTVSVLFLGVRFYINHLQIVPVEGGEYIEGLVGNPKYINPLYASFSDVDSDITSLIFSSLLKRDKNGQLAKDLALNYEISEDGKEYTFKIRTDAKWHNNAPLTIDDIIFTFNIIKDGRYSSPLQYSFNGVDIEKVDESTLKFILVDPYAAFLELLTFGIIPQDLWYQITPNSAGLAELNLKPVGSGVYKFKSLVKDTSGGIKLYNLTANDDYYGQKAKITNLSFKFFPNFEEALKALNEGQINGVSYLPKGFESNLVAKDSLNLYKLNLPQITAIFFNQKNNEALKEKSVRQALAMAINKNSIIEKAINGDAYLVDGPLLPNSFAYSQENKKYNYNKQEAEKLLDEAGWKITELTSEIIASSENDKLSEDEKTKKGAEEKLAVGAGKWRNKNGAFLKVKITTVDADENAEVINEVKGFWEAIGIKTETELISKNSIESSTIKPRNYEALFYSQILGADPDLYVLWHSSQIGESGLNLPNYANKEVDLILEEARITSNTDARKEKYKKFQEIILEDLPVIFMYSPTYTYVQGKKVKGFDTNNILTPKDRFSNVSDWYMKTGKELIW